ncbi:hypothetical protein LWC05_04815 [Acetobacter sicerae]|uniref:Uncharacterized protein n=1 Tax=Acetobacter sicerae TaxID=85325 RepID=A0ABS8VUD1_9PROT|nr:hypothetical protein [Acetobacter sicerae]MCE0743214.1 hypothetical protein [Acetobacter sicerae]
MDRHPSQAWFAVRRYGYGAGRPISWQGWSLWILFLGVTLIPSLVVPWIDLSRPLLAEGLVMLVDGIAIVSFVLICKARTDGDWRWRWGNTTDDQRSPE